MTHNANEAETRKLNAATYDGMNSPSLCDEGRETISDRFDQHEQRPLISVGRTSPRVDNSIVICSATESDINSISKIGDRGNSIGNVQPHSRPLPRFLDEEGHELAPQPGAYSIPGRLASSSLNDQPYTEDDVVLDRSLAESGDMETLEERSLRGTRSDDGIILLSTRGEISSVVVTAELVDLGEMEELEALRETKLRELEELEAIRQARTNEIRQLETLRDQAQNHRNQGNESVSSSTVLAIPIKQIRCLGMQMSQRTVILMYVVIALIVVDILVLGLVTMRPDSNGVGGPVQALGVSSPTSSPSTMNKSPPSVLQPMSSSTTTHKPTSFPTTHTPTRFPSTVSPTNTAPNTDDVIAAGPLFGSDPGLTTSTAPRLPTVSPTVGSAQGPVSSTMGSVPGPVSLPLGPVPGPVQSPMGSVPGPVPSTMGSAPGPVSPTMGSATRLPTASPTKRIFGAFIPQEGTDSTNSPSPNEITSTSSPMASPAIDKNTTTPKVPSLNETTGSTSSPVASPAIHTNMTGSQVQPKQSSKEPDPTNVIIWVLLGSFSLLAVGMLFWSFTVGDKAMARTSS